METQISGSALPLHFAGVAVEVEEDVVVVSVVNVVVVDVAVVVDVTVVVVSVVVDVDVAHLLTATRSSQRGSFRVPCSCQPNVRYRQNLVVGLYANAVQSSSLPHTAAHVDASTPASDFLINTLSVKIRGRLLATRS